MNAAARRGSWRVAVRLARRDVTQSKGRTALVASMVGVPVMLVVVLSTLVHTNDISPREGLTAALGQSQALITLTDPPGQTVVQAPDASNWEAEGSSDGSGSGAPATGSAPAETPAHIQSLTGGRLVPLRWVQTRIGDSTFALPVQLRELDTTDPATRGIVSLRSGRLPRSPGEIAVTPALSRLGWRVGRTLTDADTHQPLTVVGTYSALGMSGSIRETLTLPGTLSGSADSRADTAGATYLLVRDQPVSWAEVQRLNQSGLVVESRAVVEHPPSADSFDRAQKDMGAARDTRTEAVLVIVIVSIVIEVILLAGPAFAVGVRRRRRDLALLAATGSSPRDIRRGVLTHAGLVGGGAAIVGALLGLPLAWIAMPIAEHFGAGLGPYDWRWREVLLALAIGAAAAVIAALAPAVQASREDVATVLAGRRGTVRSRRGWPLLGLILLAAGSGVALTKGTRPGGELWVAGGTIVIVLGAVAATPWLIGQVGRLATRLPLALRLATRDAARQRGRSAPAVAAIMASVIGITALAIGFASDTEQSRQEYVAQSAPGIATVTLSDRSPAAQREIAGTIHDVLPGRALAPGYQVLPKQTASPSGSPVADGFVIAPAGCTLTQANGESSTDNRCLNAASGGNVIDQFAAYEPSDLATFGVHLNAHARAVLAAGGVLVSTPALLRGDQVLIGLLRFSSDGTTSKTLHTYRLPGALLPSAGPRVAGIAAALITPETARSLGLDASMTRYGIGGPVLTRAQQASLSGKLTVQSSEIYVERGFQAKYGLVLTLLALVAGLVVIVAAVTATGLAMSEAKPDLATLAAVGAPPRTRRLVAAGQSLVVGLMGTLLGVALGFIPGLAVTWPLTSPAYSSAGVLGGPGAIDPVLHGHGPTIDIPWLMLLAVVIAVPLIAALVTGTFTRSRLPMVRRLAT